VPGDATVRFELPGGCRLRPLEESDAEELTRLVEANRDYLAQWLPWAAGGGNLATHLEFIRATRVQLEEDNGFQTAIVDGGAIAGVIGFHRVDWANGSTSIGYWIAAACQGRGIVTEAVRALTTHAFEVWKLNRVEIRAAPGNTRSVAIPLRLGFVHEGVIRQAERHRDGFKDLAVYSMLAADWPSSTARTRSV
jgi:ribosomal-protein-serine acetyltransferase